MDETPHELPNHLTVPLSDFESKCLQQLGGALRKLWKTEGTSITEQASICEQDKDEAQDDSLKKERDCKELDQKKFLAFLERSSGALLVVGLLSKLCIYAEVSRSLQIKQDDLIGRRLDDIIHEEDQPTFNDVMMKVPSPNTVAKGSASIVTCTCRFHCKPGHGTSGTPWTSGVCYAKMKCIGVVEHLKGEPLLREKEESHFLVCVASPASDVNNNEVPTRGPPNQTINTRGEIPQPERFFTRQNMTGYLEAISIDPTSLLSSAPTPPPPAMKNLIDRWMESFNDRCHNGMSIKEIILPKVLRQGQATSPLYKFILDDGVGATSQTKSSLTECQRGRKQYVVSVHSVYRNGTLSSTNLPGFPTPTCNVSPVSMETTSARETVTTTTAIATTPPIQVTGLETSNTLLNTTMSVGQTGSYVGGRYGSWQRQPRSSLEATKEFLAGVGGTESSFENANGVVSPPPHLDGNLVHAVGAHNTPASEWRPPLGGLTKPTLPCSVANNTSLSTPSGVQMSTVPNPATFPGPPCIDLSRLDFVGKECGLSSVAPSSVTPMIVNGITTMRKEAAVTTTALVENGSLLDHNATTSRSSAVMTPPGASTMHRSSLPKRPRSASTNATLPSSNPLKRSSSTISEDNGIDDGPHKVKPFLMQRSRSKDKSKTSEKKNQILAQLLHAKSTEESVVSSSLASTQIKQDTQTQHGGFSTSGLSPVTVAASGGGSMFQGSRAPPAGDAAPMNNFMIAPVVCRSHIHSSVSTSNFTSPGTTLPNSTLMSRQFSSVSTSVSAEESRELDEIFDSMSDLLAPSGPPLNPPNNFASNLPQFPVNNDNIVGNMSTMNQNAPPSMPANIPDPGQLASPNMMTSTLGSNLDQSIFNTSQHPMTSPTGQNFSINNGYNLLPAKQELCPNRVVSTAGMVAPRPPQLPSNPQYRSDFSGPDNFAGNEPLIDLGANPPPPGINPRMAIPIPASMGNLGRPMHPRSQMGHAQNSMPYQSSNVGIPRPTHPNTPLQQSFHYDETSTHSNAPLCVSMDARLPEMDRHVYHMHPTSSNYMTWPLQEGSGVENSVMTGNAPPSNFPPLQPNRTATYNQSQQPGMVVNGNNNVRGSLLGQLQSQPQQQVHQVQGGFNTNMGIPQHSLKANMTSLIRQRRFEGMQRPSPGLERSMSTPSGQNIFPTHFAQGQQNNQLFSPGNSPAMNRPLLPQYDFPIRSNNPMASQNPGGSSQRNGVTGGAYNVTSLPANNSNNVTSRSPVAKQPVKRTRSAKNRKNNKLKQGGSAPQWEDSTTNAYKQRPLQITIGGLHERPQAMYNSSMGGSTTTNMAPPGGQQLNLNSLFNGSKPADKVRFDIPPTSSGFPSATSSASDWSEVEKFKGVSDGVSMPSSFMNGMIPDILSKPSSLSLSSDLDELFSGSDNDVMNSNLNNNNLINQFATSMTSASSAHTVTSSDLCKPKRRKTQLLETLLLKKD